MLQVGERVAGASVWTAPHQQSTIQELLQEGPALFLFYLFDWSST
jgi:hypothetical protein